MQERIVSVNESGQRLDKLLAKYMKRAPQSFFYKMLRKKNITLNGKKATGAEKIQTGDVIRLFLSDETIEKFTEQPKQIKVHTQKNPLRDHLIYEDEHILLFNKPAGMLSQKAKETDVSAVEYLIDYLLSTGQLTGEELRTFHPSFCNRLDRNTSGLLAAGKSMTGLQELSRFFKERSIGKYYLCIVYGQVEQEQCVDGWLWKEKTVNQVHISSDEKPDSVRIQTAYRPLKGTRDATLLEVHLITGKTHQIRAHLAAQGHPILGDYKYGNRMANEKYRQAYGLESQLLHAYRVVMPQTDGALSYLSGQTFRAEPPKQFQTICRELFSDEWNTGESGTA